MTGILRVVSFSKKKNLCLFEKPNPWQKRHPRYKVWIVSMDQLASQPPIRSGVQW